MSFSIAVVGAGRTAIYSLQALLARAPAPARVTIFERQRRAGQGTPYSAHWSDPIMLANIASKTATEDCSIAMFSRKGILPEGDFYHPLPYEPLVICAAEAMQTLIAQSSPDVLLGVPQGK